MGNDGNEAIPTFICGSWTHQLNLLGIPCIVIIALEFIFILKDDTPSFQDVISKLTTRLHVSGQQLLSSAECDRDPVVICPLLHLLCCKVGFLI